MTIKELKDNLLLALYRRYKDDRFRSISLITLCKEDDLIYDTLPQLSAAAKSLTEAGYINATFFAGGDARIMSFNARGIEYVEEHLLTDEDLIADGLKDSSKLMEDHVIDFEDNIEIPVIKKKEEDNKQLHFFKPRENIKPIKDLDVDPCFSVNEIADCFIKQLDTIGGSNTENTPMIGVFAPWGRGKSYFLEHVFKQLEIRNRKAYKGPERKYKKRSVKYKIVKFNAWKYQDTPAIWAYLFETIYKHTTFWQKILIYIKKRIYSYEFWLWVALLLIMWIIGFWLKGHTSILDKIDGLKTVGGIGMIIAIIGSFFLTLKEDPVSAYKILKKYTHRNTYSECLGIQNAIEKDLEKILWALTRCKDRVILCVDDIDRCSTEKMISIVDSLRTVLENDKIRKRLIVICSIDVEKLMNGYRFVDNELTKDNVREQIDKVFIFGMGLAKLGKYQLKEYLQKMTNVKGSKRNKVLSETPSKIDRNGRAPQTINDNFELIALSDGEIYAIISEFIEKTPSRNITPRKLRIMYYQLLFANNLASKQGVILTKGLIDKLLSMSLIGYDAIVSDETIGDIIEMAVPY